MDGLFKVLDIAASGMTAERFRLNVISQNLANSDTTRTEEGGPYRRKAIVFEEALNKTTKGREEFSGVKIFSIVDDPSPFRLVYDPNHPDANEEGYVEYPNVNVLREMIDMISAQRAYEMNAAVVNSAKSMYNSALGIGR
ncbi:flagellar basal body rod protein FlgC [Petrotoga sp. 9PW.55.5.1]|nr:flagellar basal body rod protein FlgC [Petrotoga sp. 9PW.55.5.1]